MHVAQLMPLTLTVCCFSKIQTGFTFLAPAHPGSPGKRAVKRVCVYSFMWEGMYPAGRLTVWPRTQAADVAIHANVVEVVFGRLNFALVTLSRVVQRERVLLTE